MKYIATIELKDDTRCDDCPFFIDGPDGRYHCTLGDFYLHTVRDQTPQLGGFYHWHTPRPRGCPLKPIDNGRAETVAECLRRLREIEAMSAKKDKPMYEVEK